MEKEPLPQNEASVLEDQEQQPANNGETSKIETQSSETTIDLPKSSEPTKWADLPDEGKRRVYEEMKQQEKQQKQRDKEKVQDIIQEIATGKKEKVKKPTEIFSETASSPTDIEVFQADTGVVAMPEVKPETEKKEELAPEIKKPAVEVEGALLGQLEKEAEKEFDSLVAQEKIKDKEGFIKERASGVVQKSWQELYQKAYEEMSPRQQKKFADWVSGREEHKVLSPNEIAGLAVAGFTLEDIKNVKWAGWFSPKIKSKLSKEAVGEDEFDALIKKTIKEKQAELEVKAKQDLGSIWDERREKFIEQKLEREIAWQRTQEKKAAVEAEKQAAWQKTQEKRATLETEKQAAWQRTQEKAEAKERIKAMDEELKVFENKPEAKLEKLNHLRNLWTNAERINKALKSDRVVDLGQEKLDAYLGADREKLLEMRGHLSDDIIDTADQLQDRNLRKEFWDKKFEEGKIASATPTEEEKDLFRREFREWITGQVKEIFNKSVKEVESATGKKVKAKSEFSKALESLGDELEVRKPIEIEKSKKRNKGPTKKVKRLGVKKGARSKPIIKKDFENMKEPEEKK
jgi:hypothetical protein